MRVLVLLCLMFASVSACSVTHEKLWSCMVDNAATYNTTCVTATDIHRAIYKNSNILTRAMVFVAEGSSYEELVKDCDDTDGDKCISIEEAIHNTKCERSCLWKKSFAYILGCK